MHATLQLLHSHRQTVCDPQPAGMPPAVTLDRDSMMPVFPQRTGHSRRPLQAALLDPFPRRIICALDEGCATTVIVGRSLERAEHWDDVQPHVLREVLDVVHKLARNEQVQRVQGLGDRACWRPRQPTGKSSGQHDNSVGAELQCGGNRRVIGHAAIEQFTTIDQHRGKDAGYCCARQNRVDRRARRNQDFITSDQIGRDDMDGDRSLLQ